jgi:hypothetical protein
MYIRKKFELNNLIIKNPLERIDTCEIIIDILVAPQRIGAEADGVDVYKINGFLLLCEHFHFQHHANERHHATVAFAKSMFRRVFFFLFRRRSKLLFLRINTCINTLSQEMSECITTMG